MIRIFISYMRKDQLFVRRLHETLVAQGHDVWADFEDIPLSSKWLAEIYDGIEKADVILSVLSPEYLISENCNKEVEHSVKHNKRIIPIVRRDVDFRQVPKALAEINAIFFRESEDFDAKFKDLSDTINLDLAWTKAHTRLLTRAIEWDSKKRDESLVLRGADLRTAEEWSAQAATGKEPKPTPLQSEYILASRKSATRQQRMILTGVTIALVVAIGLACLASILGLFAWDQSNVATNQKNTAVAERNVRATAEAQAIAERNVAQSRELATNAILLSTNDPELSIRLALEAYTLVPSPQVEEALRIALANPARLVLRGHMLGVSSATFSPDGKRIITGSIDETARIWDARTGKTLMELKGHTDPVMSTEFSPDGQYVVTADWGGKTRVWNATTGQVVREFTGTIASFSPDSKSIVTASVNSVSIWQVSTDRLVMQFRGHLDNVNTAKFSPDGKFLATASNDKTAKIWDVNSGKVIADLSHSLQVSSAAFSPDGKRLVTASWNLVQIWDVTTGKSIMKLQEPVQAVAYADFSPNGKFVVTASARPDCAARVWDISEYDRNQSAPTQAFLELRGHAGLWLNMATFSSDGKQIVTASDDNTARVWDINAGDSVYELGGINSLSPDWKLTLTTSGDNIQIRDRITGQSLFNLSGQKGPIQLAAFSPDSKWIVTVGSNTARVWESNTGKLVSELIGRGGLIGQAVSSPDGKLLATLDSDKTTRIWETATGKNIVELQEYQDGAGKVEFSPDGNWVITFGSNTARISDSRTGRLISDLGNIGGFPREIAISPDGKRIVIPNGYDGNIWQVQTGKIILRLVGHTSPIWAVAFSPNGKYIITAGSDYVARLWDATSGKDLGALLGHKHDIEDVQFSNDSKFVLTASDDHIVRVWQVSTGRLMLDLHGAGRPQTASFSPDNRFIATTNQGKTRVYACDICGSLEDLVALAHGRVSRELTCEERQTYLHETITCPTPLPAPISIPTRASTPTPAPAPTQSVLPTPTVRR